MPVSPKLSELHRIIGGMESAIVAFSAGVDSTFVAAAAADVLGERAIAVTGVSPSIPVAEVAELLGRTPNATEAIPARMSSHSLVITLRNCTAATISMMPITMAQAAIIISKPSAVIPGKKNAINPAAMLSIPPKIKAPNLG